MSIKYVIGDATDPIKDNDCRFILHVTNNKQRWGRGFVLALSKRWQAPEKKYMSEKQELGDIQIIPVEPGLFVVNMCAQNGFVSPSRPVALDYNALLTCLGKVVYYAHYRNASIHAPRFGAGLAGGDWATIEHMLNNKICYLDIPVTIYDLQ